MLLPAVDSLSKARMTIHKQLLHKNRNPIPVAVAPGYRAGHSGKSSKRGEKFLTLPLKFFGCHPIHKDGKGMKGQTLRKEGAQSHGPKA